MRKHENPLFSESERSLTPGTLEEAQKLDHEELVAYIGDLRKLVGEAIALGPHEQSDVILSLKERLDKSYETACGLADNQSDNKAAIKKLISVIMQTVWKGAGNDTLARQELEQEEEARKLHYEVLEYPLVADLLSPDSVIREDELIAVLLSEERDDFEAAVTLFDPVHIESLCAQGKVLLQAREAESSEMPDARSRLRELETLLQA
ncbi:MAG: hypothetical protein JMN27_00475 [gamma proteobacterium endosymbiont of Lamellibrachia anaximandri]|nr:hypothetical protein [gamma proteobacterium endosymbiont of Lamellibrachia anaximandri]MBL3532291.1 hypothetical protein [gamma proteobacterium endosymbiont of Lamellibrachia anaximandri]MBL3601424.1 hypothetical protein [gamma proteobacterium endosymbiont of Lamellibrachia anaximandri]